MPNVQGKSLWYFQSGLVFVLWLGLKTAELCSLLHLLVGFKDLNLASF